METRHAAASADWCVARPPRVARIAQSERFTAERSRRSCAGRRPDHESTARASAGRAPRKPRTPVSSSSCARSASAVTMRAARTCSASAYDEVRIERTSTPPAPSSPTSNAKKPSVTTSGMGRRRVIARRSFSRSHDGPPAITRGPNANRAARSDRAAVPSTSGDRALSEPLRREGGLRRAVGLVAGTRTAALALRHSSPSK